MAVNLLSDQNKAELLEPARYSIVKFYADWCGSCRLITPKYTKLSQDERFADVTFLETNAETNPELRALAKVSNLPTFATFRNGELVHSDSTSKIESVEKMLAELKLTG
jgi:thiol-disulfide isomerase/thioredoxin